MRVYRWLWLSACVPVTVLGLVLGLVQVLDPLVVVAPFFGALAAVVTWVWLEEHEDTRGPALHPARLVATNALTVAAATGAVFGYAVALGPVALVLLVVLLSSSPYAVRVYGRWLRSVPTPSPAQLDKMARALSYASSEYMAFPPASGLGTLTDEELCHSWRASFATPQRPPSAAQTASTVIERQACLDELARRNPQGFAAWLASEERAPGNPLPYLRGRRAQTPTINWDELIRGQDW